MAKSARPSKPKADTSTAGGKRQSEYSPPSGYGQTNDTMGNVAELMRNYNRNVRDRSNGE